MELKEATVKATIQTFTMLGMSVMHVLTTKQSSLSSGSQVNVIIGFTEGIKGNILFEMDKQIALKIASVLIGENTLSELDEISISAVAELCNIIVGNTFTLCSDKNYKNFSPPSVVIGDNLLLMLSRVETVKLQFLVDGVPFYALISDEASSI